MSGLLEAGRFFGRAELQFYFDQARINSYEREKDGEEGEGGDGAQDHKHALHPLPAIAHRETERPLRECLAHGFRHTPRHVAALVTGAVQGGGR